MPAKPASSVSGMPFEQNHPGFEPRQGQRELIQWMERLPKEYVVVQWPTGYGKSIGAALVFRHLREIGKADRLLIISANDLQRRQLEMDFGGDCRMIGLDVKPVQRFRNEAVTARLNRTSAAEIFIVNIQMVSSTARADIDTLLNLVHDHGRWMIWVDEFHHPASDRDWGQSLVRLLDSAAFVLATSATPYRKIGQTLFGEPDLVVSYQEAVKDARVKNMIKHMYHYRVDTLTKDNEPVSYETEQLRTQIGIDNIDRFEERQELRYTAKYVWPILSNPIARLVDTKMKWMTYGIHVSPQMLVRAMSCSHAKSIAEQIKTMVGDSFSVDWVGTGIHGRDDRDNERIINQFCPSKDLLTGKRSRPTLDILVQVKMAGEGMDSVPVTEIVDLSLTSCMPPATTDKQMYGRGARVIGEGLPKELQICHVNVPTDHPLAGHDGLLNAWFDDQPLSEPERPTCEERLREVELALETQTIAAAIEVVDEHIDKIPELALVREALIDGKRGRAIELLSKITKPNGDYEPEPLPKEPPRSRQVELIDITSDDPHFRRFAEAVAQQPRGYDLNNANDLAEIRHLFEFVLGMKATEEQKKMTMEQLRSAIDTAIGKLAWRAIRSRKQIVEKSALGDVKRTINTRIKREFSGERSALMPEELEKVYKWCVALEEELLAGRSPSWLR